VKIRLAISIITVRQKESRFPALHIRGTNK
jgi:hypothetical protein